MSTLMDLSSADRETVQREMIAAGSALAEIGDCGADGLPCGVCDECLSHAQECEICCESMPSRTWPAVGHVGSFPACADCVEHVRFDELGSAATGAAE